MAKDIYSIEATTKMRIEDMIQLAFDAETEARGKVVVKGSKEEEKKIKKEEKEIFLWLMKFVHETGVERLQVNYYRRGDVRGLLLETPFVKRDDERIKYISQYGESPVAFSRLVRKMAATGKVKVVEETGSYKVLEFRFR